MELAPDFDEFIGSLIAHGVEFVVVGAYALAFHGAPRFTGDLDVLVRPTLDNASRLLTAVEAFGFPVPELTPAAVADRRKMLQTTSKDLSARTGCRFWGARHSSATSVRPRGRRILPISTP